jgi:hypothetical protein
LGVNEVNRKVGSGVKETEDMFEDMFFSGFIDWEGRKLCLVKVTEGSVGCASGSTIFVDIWKVFGVFGNQKIIDTWVERRAIVNITGKVGFCVVCS